MAATTVFALLAVFFIAGGAYQLGERRAIEGREGNQPGSRWKVFLYWAMVVTGAMVMSLFVSGFITIDSGPSRGQKVTVLEVYRRLDDNRRVAVIGWFEGKDREGRYREDKIFPDEVLAGGPYSDNGPRLNSQETLVLQADGTYARTISPPPAATAASGD